jgi:NAD(P)-dependent dehydrogenase (short-subunit alcohol dehydrogenase family)
MSKALAEAGADVAMMYVSNDSTHDTAAAIGKQFNKNVRAYKCELTNVDQVREVIDKIHADYGRIDIFVANAGVSEGGAAEVMLLENSMTKAYRPSWSETLTSFFLK